MLAQCAFPKAVMCVTCVLPVLHVYYKHYRQQYTSSVSAWLSDDMTMCYATSCLKIRPTIAR